MDAVSVQTPDMSPLLKVVERLELEEVLVVEPKLLDMVVDLVDMVVVMQLPILEIQ